MKQQHKVVGIGEVLWDMLPDGKKLGGAPANFAYHAGQFGLPSLLVSAIGSDSLGRELIHALEEKNLHYEIATVDHYPTGTVAVELDSTGIPTYDITRNVAWDHIPVTDNLMALAVDTAAVCFGSLAQRSPESRATIMNFIDAIPAENSPLIVFDANLRQDFHTPEILTTSMSRANVLKINDEELLMLRDMLSLDSSSSEAGMCRDLMERYSLSTLILTCGINGSHVFTATESSFLPTPKVKVADTVGAGDSFTAAFIASLLKGRSIAEAHRKAVDTSAFVCSSFGAMPLLPTPIVE